MDELPTRSLAEVFDAVDALPPWLAGASEIRHQVEAELFASFRITNKSRVWQRFYQEVCLHPERRLMLQKLHMHFVLGDTENPILSPSEAFERAKKNDVAFTSATHRLFSLLKALDDPSQSSQRERPFSLHFTYAVRDGHPGSYNRLEDVAETPQRPDNFYKYIAFSSFYGLSTLRFVKQFSSDDSSLRVHPKSMAAILEALPSVCLLNWKHYAPPHRLEDLKVEVRESLSSTLSNLDFYHLETLHIHHVDTDPLNHNFAPLDFINDYDRDNYNGRDCLSRAVNRVLRLPRLREAKLSGSWILSPDVFSMDKLGPPFSESLRVLHLELSMMTPHERWYFTGESDLRPIEDSCFLNQHLARGMLEDSAQEDYNDYNLINSDWGSRTDRGGLFSHFRHHPDPYYMDNFLWEMARAVIKMPALRQFRCLFSQCKHAEITWTPASEPGPLPDGKESFDVADPALLQPR